MRGATDRFAATGIETARLDAELLLSYVLECPRMALYGKLDAALSSKQRDTFDALVQRRETHEPIAYILGEQEFWSLSFKVTADTLIPRPDTEALVEVGLKALKGRKHPHILDLGTGSGCILLSLLHERPDGHGTGVEKSPEAMRVAMENAERLRLPMASFRLGDWFQTVVAPEFGYDLIVSNPPYIPSADIAGLMPDVRNYEPMSALDGGEDGLTPYRILTSKAPYFLNDKGPNRESGTLAVEVGIHQADDVAALFEASGFTGVMVTKDLGGIDRVVSGKKS
ncbi:MAG: peptide chain release factor N(5)-glutamine methyltransferase [Alphaproteobacteria bacterium]|nr:peptide chain release factor N(5)-glutamine methyltransferase [Alphaproteobacteria bacterium]